MSAGKITLYIATSVDGYVADTDGGVDWLEEFDDGSGNADDSFAEFFESVDCLVVGATTYEQVLTLGEWPYGDRPTYVLTHRDLPLATDAVELVERPVADLSTELRRQYDHVWVVGGAAIARAFLNEREIDDLRLSLVPVLLGGGIPLFDDNGVEQWLRLLDTTVGDAGVVEHHYEIVG